MYAYIAFSTIQKKVKLYAALSSSSFHTPLIGLILDRKLNLCPNNAKFGSRPLPKSIRARIERPFQSSERKRLQLQKAFPITECDDYKSLTTRT